MMTHRSGLLTTCVSVMITAAGCANGLVTPEPGLPAEVASKAGEIGAQIGGVEGFGGLLMTGYLDHAPMHMGFVTGDDLASPDGTLTVRFHNETTIGGQFHLSYFASHMGLDEIVMNVDVAAGEVIQVELPCAEIVGLGPPDVPGSVAMHLQDGQIIDNTMAVPGFLGLDYTCGDVFDCFFGPDVDDLDGDGDTEELVVTTEAMLDHMESGGPIGHHHDAGLGMMGPHMKTRHP